MRKVIILLWLHLSVNCVYAQLFKTDSITFIGVPTSKFTTVYESIGQYCLGDGLNVINSPKYFLITGINDCYKGYSTNQYFEVTHRTKVYLVERKSLATKDEDLFEKFILAPENAKSAYRDRVIQLDSSFQIVRREQLFDEIEKSKKYGLLISDWGISDESEHTEGTSVFVNVYNPGSKTIKYIWFSFVGKNPVGDKVLDRVRKTSTITTRGVGPIKPNESGSYTFEYAWFTDMVSTANIVSIKIQFMDGTFKTITNPKTIILKEDLRPEFETDDE